jgi:hypothetical protein
MRIGGIPVRADASWFVILALLTWSFWTRFNLSPDPPINRAGRAFRGCEV